MTRYRRYKPRKNPRFDGAKKCVRWRKASICVEGHRFGFSAWLTTVGGKRLAPISVSSARSMKAAIRQAVGAASRISGRG